MLVCDRGGRPARPMPTINVLTFNVFENGLACRGSLLGRLKPRRYLVSYLDRYPPSQTYPLHFKFNEACWLFDPICHNLLLRYKSRFLMDIKRFFATIMTVCYDSLKVAIIDNTYNQVFCFRTSFRTKYAGFRTFSSR